MRRGLLIATALLTPALLLAPTDGTAAAAGARRGPPSSAAGAAHAWLSQSAAFLPGTSCPVFPADNIWHADVSRLKVSPYSARWLSHMGVSTRKLHADFGPSYGAQPVPYGIPVTIVNGGPRVPVAFAYASESDPGPYPLSTSTKIEGGPNASGDRHAIVVDAATCTLFETYDTQLTNGRWTAGSGAIWSLRSDALRPSGWTSADAAGLAILPGLLTYDEVVRGTVDHAIRFTTNVTDKSFIWPARHSAGSVSSSAYPPMGARFRLKSSFSITGYSRDAQVVLTAMKKYGLVLADNGSPWYFQGTSDTRWTDAIVSQLGQVPASAFEAVDTAPLLISNNSGAARPA
ncbi:MAG: hypothetical protein ABI468_04690 [Candidatus Nanopelagicales bacterium]